MKRLGLAGRMGLLAAMAVAIGHAPQEAQDIFAAPRPPREPPDPKDPKATTRNMKTAQDLEVELPKMVEVPVPERPSEPPTVLRVDHAMHAIIKAKAPQLNRKQRRQLAHRLQANATKKRGG